MPSTIVRQATPEFLFSCFRVSVPRHRARAAHTHEVHEFFACLDGCGTQFAGRTAIPQKRGALFCFPAGMPHYCSGAPHAHGFVFMIPETLFAPESYGDREVRAALRRAVRLAEEGCNPLPLARGTGMLVLEYARMMAREFTERRAGYQAGAKRFAMEILLALLRDPGVGGEQATDFRSRSADEKMARVLRVIDAHFMEPIRVKAMGELAGMGRSRFHEEFRRATGCTLVEYVTRVRVRAAQRRLRETDARVLDIALDCGFPSLSRFYVAFRALTGGAPGRVRATDGL